MDKPDFFLTNGTYIDIPESHLKDKSQKEKVFCGHSNIFVLNE